MLLGSAVCRLAPLAMDAFSYEFQWYHSFSLGAVVLFMAYAEGYRGFHKRFSPRVAARARYLKNHPKASHVLFAPFFCMSYFYAPRKRKITSISLTAGIIVLIILVRLVPQPWRGIIDAGVVIGLAWGIISILVFGFQAVASAEFNYPPEIPEKN